MSKLRFGWATIVAVVLVTGCDKDREDFDSSPPNTSQQPQQDVAVQTDRSMRGNLNIAYQPETSVALAKPRSQPAEFIKVAAPVQREAPVVREQPRRVINSTYQIGNRFETESNGNCFTGG